jgi:carbamoyltransferase
MWVGGRLCTMPNMEVNSNSESRYILGLSFGFHDSAAVILKDGVLLAATQEERFTRIKHDSSFPTQAIADCLNAAGIQTSQLEAVVYYEKPIRKFERQIISWLRTWPWSWSQFLAYMPAWAQQQLWVAAQIRRHLKVDKLPIYFSEHHVSHAASAFYPSPFTDAAVIIMDGVGEWATVSYGVGHGSELSLHQELHYPDSLGLFYSAVTYFLGFTPNADEYKVMGLAPYGVPKYLDQLRSLCLLDSDGAFHIKNKYLTRNFSPSNIERVLTDLLGFSRRMPEAELEQIHKDLAASLQELTNETVVHIARHVQKVTGQSAVCLAGGVALNCVSNTVLWKQAGFKQVWVQPAAGDAGGALGAASWYWHTVLRQPRKFCLTHVAYGPEFSSDQIKQFLDSKQLSYIHKSDPEQLCTYVAQRINDQAVVGWFQGRMEWGPRALGQRSVLADARQLENWQRVNLKIKFRESFRPFAPAVLSDYFDKYFEGPANPYMLFTAQVKQPSLIPAVTHVDGSARVQVVDRQVLPTFGLLLEKFYALTGVPILINTSFNVRGEPIVCTPEDAWETFIKTNMDVLVLGEYILEKTYARSDRNV